MRSRAADGDGVHSKCPVILAAGKYTECTTIFEIIRSEHCVKVATRSSVWGKYMKSSRRFDTVTKK